MVQQEFSFGPAEAANDGITLEDNLSISYKAKPKLTYDTAFILQVSAQLT